MAIDPNMIVKTITNEDGVLNLTVGNLASDHLRRVVTATLKRFDPDAYQRYKVLKFPHTGATIETRRQAYEFALSMFGQFVMKHYQRIEA